MEAAPAETTENNFASFMNVCGVCKETFQSKDPKLLPCLHTFCYPCITLQTSENNTITCPTCHQECTTAELIDNHFILDLSTTPDNDTNQEDSTPKCTACEENMDATSFCTDCSEWLCDQCVQAHRRVRVTKDHLIQLKEEVVRSTPGQMSQRMMYCPVHKQESLKLFCETCDRLTCRDCQLLEHKEHRYHFVHEASAQYKQFLQTLVGKIREKRTYINNAKSLINRRYKEISDKEHQVTNEIKMFAISLIQEINRRGKHLLGDLNAVCGSKKAQLGQKNSEIIGLSLKLDHCLKFAEFIIAKGNSSAILYSKKLMVNQLRRVLKTRCEVPNPNHVVDIRFKFDNQYLSNYIAGFGELIVDGLPYSSASRKLPGQQTLPGIVGQNASSSSSQPTAASPASPITNGIRLNNNMTLEQKNLLVQKLRQRQLQHQQQQGSSPALRQGTPHDASNHGNTNNSNSNMQRLSHQPNSSSHVTSTRPALNQVVKTGGVYYPPSGLGNVAQAYRHPQSTSSMVNNTSGGQMVSQNPMINLAQVQQRLLARQQHQHAGLHIPSQSPNHMNNQPSSTTSHGVGGLRPAITNQLVVPPGANMQKSLWPMSLPPPNTNKGASPMQSGLLHSHQMAASVSGSGMPNVLQRTSPAGRLGQGSVSPASSDRTQTFSPSQSGIPQHAEPQTTTTSRPSSSDSNVPSSSPAVAVHVKREPGTPSTELPSCSYAGVKVKREPARILDINPSDYSFDSDPAMFLSDIKKELRLEAQANTQQSTSETAFNLNEPITDQIITNNTTSSSGEASNSQSQNDDPNEDWCGCCHNGGDLLCCDNCPKVFHKDCHIPVLEVAPSGTWNCSLCRPVENLRITEDIEVEIGVKRKASDGLDPRELGACERILLELMCHEASPPFHEPVPEVVPNYYSIITHPMDFGTVKQKLSKHHFNHYQVVEDFLADCRLVFKNCATYNIEESEVGQAGLTLKNFFHSLVEKFLPAYLHRVQAASPPSRDTHTPLSEASSDTDGKQRPHKRKKRISEGPVTIN